jgi:hypothetical protein
MPRKPLIRSFDETTQFSEADWTVFRTYALVSSMSMADVASRHNITPQKSRRVYRAVLASWYAGPNDTEPSRIWQSSKETRAGLAGQQVGGRRSPRSTGSIRLRVCPSNSIHGAGSINGSLIGSMSPDIEG